MDAWVLIIAMFGQDGKWVDQYVEGPIDTQQECAQRKYIIDSESTSAAMTFKGLCVTHDHWTGKKFMPDVALD
jgi:hypothetical protein